MTPDAATTPAPDAAVPAVDAAPGAADATPQGPDAAPASDLVVSESFDGDAAQWPAPWVVAGGVAEADVQGGRARLVPVLTAYSLARMSLAGAEVDVDVRFEVEFTDLSTQGVGFYVRQNGGYLQQTSPVGAGYAVFVEGFRTAPGIGVWREVGGDEQQIHVTWNPIPNLRDGVVYQVRFAVAQQGASTALRAKLWETGTSEPVEWAVDVLDATPSLQNVAGGFAVDSWSSHPTTAADLFVDSIAIRRLD